MQRNYLLFGASSSIAQAYIKHLHSVDSTATIIGVSRHPLEFEYFEFIQTDYSQQSLNQLTEVLKARKIDLHQVIIFNGLLHTANNMPEKRLEDISGDYFHKVITANTLTPLLCLQAIFPLLTASSSCTITALSARVGSIEDNHLGGWYSYRASKAALNMLFKTAAIEISRKAKHARLILFHPGTTDTELSKPFQKNVPANALFTPEFVAKQLYNLLADADQFSNASEPAYIDWQGKSITW